MSNPTHPPRRHEELLSIRTIFSPDAKTTFPDFSARSPTSMYSDHASTPLTPPASCRGSNSPLFAETRNRSVHMDIQHLLNEDSAAPTINPPAKEEGCAGNTLASLPNMFALSPLSQQRFEEFNIQDGLKETTLPPVSRLMYIADAPRRTESSRWCSESSGHKYAWGTQPTSPPSVSRVPGLPSPPPEHNVSFTTSSLQSISMLAGEVRDYRAQKRPSHSIHASCMASPRDRGRTQPRALPPWDSLPRRSQSQPLPHYVSHSTTCGIHKRHQYQQYPPARPATWAPNMGPTPPSMALARKERAKRKLPSKNKPHNNKQYELEQTDYIRYLTSDLGIPWDDINTQYNKYWGSKVDHPRRDTQGLQGVFYRTNKYIPPFSRDGKLVLDSEGNTELWTLKVRKAKEFAKDENKKDRLKLTFLYPERAIQYCWVTDEDKKLACENLAKHEAQKRTHKEMLIRGQLPPRSKPDEGYTRPDNTSGHTESDFEADDA